MNHGNTRLRKPAALLVSLLLILCIAVGGTLAVLIASTDAVVNLFSPAAVSCAIAERDGAYTITNTGDTAAYVRVAAVPNWTKAGKVYGLQPIQPGDYTVSGDGWIYQNGYYYYSSPVPAGASAGPLWIRQNAPAPSGCAFSVEVLAEAIQSQPAEAALEAWGVRLGE